MIANKNYEILTPDGFKDFNGIDFIRHNEYFVLTIGGKELKCSLDHKLIDSSGNIILAHQLKIGDLLKSGPVEDIQQIKSEIEMYDLINVSDTHTYYTNEILSHNCDCDFISSGHTIVDGEILQWYDETYVTDPVEKRGIDGNYWIWEYPNPTKSYMIVADVARGDGTDYSTFHVLDIEKVEQVAEYKGKIGTTEFGHMLVAVAHEWNGALLVIENANIGWSVVQIAIDRNYPNLYYTYKQDTYIDEEVQISKGYDLKDKSKMVPGFTTSTRTRPLIISKIETYFRERTPIVKSKRLINELFVFIWNGHKAEAQQGYNDDLVMAFGIGLWVRDTALRLRQHGLELTKQSLSHFTRTNANPSIYATGNKRDTGWAWKPTKDSEEDLTWLLG